MKMILRNLIRYGFSLCVLLAVVFQLQAQRVDTVSVYSQAMKREIKNVVILPSGYEQGETYPVVYLLHGFGNRYDSWVKHTKPALPALASERGMIIVCPDGGRSWYWDSPVNPEVRFETFVSGELPQYIDSHYRTVAGRKGRAVAGYSMGGHGALWLAFRHPDVFGACGSMSGGVDIRPFPNNWEMSKQLGSYADNQKVWDEHTVVNQISRIQPGQLAIIVDCGIDDFFYDVNMALHQKLLENKIPHDYITRPGAHTHKYWSNAVDYQMMYFDKFFQEK